MTFSVFDVATVAQYHNVSVRTEARYPEALQSVFHGVDCDKAREVICQWDGYRPTPLRSLDGLAEKLGLASLYYKDESHRFGLGSFKALGGAYAVLQVLADVATEQTGKKAMVQDIRSGAYTDLLRGVTVVTATDGNHGRSVAWGGAATGLQMCDLHACRGEPRAGQGSRSTGCDR